MNPGHGYFARLSFVKEYVMVIEVSNGRAAAWENAGAPRLPFTALTELTHFNQCALIPDLANTFDSRALATRHQRAASALMAQAGAAGASR